MKSIIIYIKKHKQLFLVSVFILLIVRIVFSIYKFNFKYQSDEKAKNMQVMVLSVNKITDDKISYLVKYNNDKFILNLYKEKYDASTTNLKEGNLYKYGDVLKLNGKITLPETLGNPYEFDYKNYLNSNDIVGLISTYKLEKKGENKENLIFNITNSLKKGYEKKVIENLEIKEASFLIATLFSDDLYLEENTKENVKSLNLSYIFNISSKNIFSIFLIIEIFRKFFKDKTINLIKIFSCIFIFFISSMSYSTLRAVIVVLINFLLPQDIKLSRIQKLIISLYIILIINPYSIFNYSVIFTYLIVISSMYFYSPFSSYITYIIKKIFKYQKLFGIKKKLINLLVKIVNIICFNISVIIFIFPLQIGISNTFNFVSIISNLFIIPLISLIHFLGYFSILFTYIFNVSDIMIHATYLPVKLLLKIIDILNTCSININLATLSTITLILYYLALAIITFKDKLLNKFLLKKKVIRKRLKLISNLIIAFTTIFIIFEQVYIMKFESYIIYFNVKQGNMCIIKCKNEVIVVDMGSTSENLSGNILNTYLKAKNINKIDLVLLTHMHSDHINGMYNLKDNVKIESVAFGKIWHNINEEYKKLMKIINEKNIKYEEVTNEDLIKLKNIDIKVLSPDKNNKINSQDEINGNSAVYDIKVKNKRFLFMGDATVDTEEYILKNNNLDYKNISVLQVGHHGSKTSSSEKFISKLDVRLALISALKKVYKHPSNETIETLEKYKIKYHITEKNKALKIIL